MKKTIKKLLIGLGALVLILILFGGWYGTRVKSEIKSMTPVETKKVVDNIYAVHESFVNMYLIEDNGEYIAIDAGNKAEDVLTELRVLGVNPEVVKAVFLTHSDGDHVASLKLYKNAVVYLSKEEEQMISGETSRFLFFSNKIGANDYVLVEDKEEIVIGNTKIKGILTPGHTPGSMCFLVNDKYLFTGDAHGIKNCQIHLFNDFFNMDSDKAWDSLQLLQGLSEAEYIFSAHYGYCADYEMAMNSF